jgi:periplasmic protein TonB
MFEGTLIESRGLMVSGTKRWTALGSAVFQFGVAGLLIAIPMMHPGMLPMHVDPPQLVVPMTKPPVVQVNTEAAASSSTAISVPAASVAPGASAPALLIRPGGDAEPEPTMWTGIHMDGGTPGGSLIGNGIGTPAPTITIARAKQVGPLNVSKGVLAGMLLSPIQPVYPPIAKATGTQGSVVMEAVISKAGRIESLHVVSGPQMLRAAALEAVQAARYQPYRLNGEATEVQTTITVVFRLGS